MDPVFTLRLFGVEIRDTILVSLVLTLLVEFRLDPVVRRGRLERPLRQSPAVQPPAPSGQVYLRYRSLGRVR